MELTFSGFFFVIGVVLNFCSAAYENNPFLNPPKEGYTTSHPAAVDHGPTVQPNEQSTSFSTAQSTTGPTTRTTTSTSSTVTKEPVFTIEPPEILYGDLNSKCLKPRGQFPSFACNKYVNCWDGRAIEQTCPAGLVFNAAKGYCDYLPNTDCGKRSLEGFRDSQTSGVAPVIVYQTPVPSNVDQEPLQSPALVAPAANSYLRSFCQNQRGLFPGSSCHKFVNCWDDNVAEFECPEGTLFSSKGYCDFAANVDCGAYKGELSTQTEQPSECPLEFGTFRDKRNCSHYYICAYSKVAAKHVCPDGLSFSDILGLCDYSYRVDCSKEPQIYTKNSQVSQAQNQIYPQQDGSIDHGTLRDPQNCSIYYVCANGKVVFTYVCPTGFSYNDDLGICDYSERVECSQSPKVFKMDRMSNAAIFPELTQETMLKIQLCTPGSIFPLNAQCSLACICRTEMAEIVQCESGMAYDPSSNKCVSANLVRWYGHML